MLAWCLCLLLWRSLCPGKVASPGVVVPFPGPGGLRPAELSVGGAIALVQDSVTSGAGLVDFAASLSRVAGVVLLPAFGAFPVSR